jgi:hypothetical protein
MPPTSPGERYFRPNESVGGQNPTPGRPGATSQLKIGAVLSMTQETATESEVGHERI